jgi:uncharacterized heparinase superfamily protein
LERLVTPAATALAAACQSDIDAEGGIPSRNPEELLDVLTLLTWSARALGESAHPVPPALSDAITRIAPALRALRHADGELARFHGARQGGKRGGWTRPSLLRARVPGCRNPSPWALPACRAAAPA